MDGGSDGVRLEPTGGQMKVGCTKARMKGSDEVEDRTR